MKPDRGRARREEDDEEKNELLDLFVLPPRLKSDGAECLE